MLIQVIALVVTINLLLSDLQSQKIVFKSYISENQVHLLLSFTGS